MRALLIEDDPIAATLLQRALEEDKIVVETTNTGEEGLELAKIYDFDVILTDMKLPDITGIHLIRRIRNAGICAPVLVVSSIDDPEQKARALSCGADDFLTKPVNVEELCARVNTVVRRSRGHATPVIKVGRMTIDLTTRSVFIDGARLAVTSKEYTVLELLALRKGQPLSKEVFLDHLYGGRDEPEQKIIDVFICKLRKKIARINNDEHNIDTLWGQGYVLKDLKPLPEQAAAAGLAESPSKFLRNDELEEVLVAGETGTDELELLKRLLSLQ